MVLFIYCLPRGPFLGQVVIGSSQAYMKGPSLQVADVPNPGCSQNFPPFHSECVFQSKITVYDTKDGAIIVKTSLYFLTSIDIKTFVGK